MALSDDDKKKALAAAAKSSSAKSTPPMSGKPAYKTGGSNPLGTRKVGTTSMPPAKTKAVSPVMVQPSKPVGKDASGSANFNRTAPSRFTGTLGPAKINYGGKTPKSTGGRNLTGYEEKSQSNSTAKTSGLISKGDPKTTVTNNYPDNSSSSWKKSNTIAVGAGIATVGAGVALTGVGKKIVEGGKKLVKYVANTKERRAARKQQNADNEAFKAERKAKAEAKNPSNTMGKDSKISKSTMKKLKRK